MFASTAGLGKSRFEFKRTANLFKFVVTSNTCKAVHRVVVGNSAAVACSRRVVETLHCVSLHHEPAGVRTGADLDAAPDGEHLQLYACQKTHTNCDVLLFDRSLSWETIAFDNKNN